MYGLVIQLKKNADFMQNMSCSFPSPKAIRTVRFMQRIHAEYRHASCSPFFVFRSDSLL